MKINRYSLIIDNVDIGEKVISIKDVGKNYHSLLITTLISRRKINLNKSYVIVDDKNKKVEVKNFKVTYYIRGKKEVINV